MIPKRIHYIWLSGDPLNYVAEKCIKSWKRYAPDYEIKHWSISDFDFSKMPAFVNEAVRYRKWAFACDYLRLYVLYNEGGLYMDSDVLLLKSIDNLLNHRFVSSVEYYPELFSENCDGIDANGTAYDDYVIGLNIQAAVMASEPGHPFVKDCMDYYKNKHFVEANGAFDTKIVAPQIYSYVARKYGFRYLNIEQPLDYDIMLYKSDIFAPDYYNASGNSVAIHMCFGSWREMSLLRRIHTSFTKAKQIRSLL